MAKVGRRVLNRPMALSSALSTIGQRRLHVMGPSYWKLTINSSSLYVTVDARLANRLLL